MGDMLYFIPEWDDLVTEEYDFDEDKDIGKKKLYAHEMYPKPNYDGILASRMKLEDSKSKLKLIKELGGVHKYYKFEGPVFGDCGAWGYIKEKDPPFETNELMDFYEDLKFDIGVSIDHLCVPGYESEWEYRKALTLKNAESFYNRHVKKGYSFKPVGVAQGWNTESYDQSIKELLDIGYSYIALGGIARSKSTEIIKILQFIQPTLQKAQNKDIKTEIHLFGVARLEAIRSFRSLGVTSFDSASPIRTAWLSSSKNYRDMNWNGYAAVRLPFLARDRKFQPLIKEGFYTLEELQEREQNLKIMMKRFEIEKSRTPEEIVEGFNNLYNEFIPKTPDRTKEYMRTLQDRPWEKCDCVICKDVGIEVIIFRGNNRNRRRGFHNTYIFYTLLKKILQDKTFTLQGELESDDESEDESVSEDTFPNKKNSQYSKKKKMKNSIVPLNEAKKGKNLMDFL
jgi:hypothetical protein